MARQSRGNFSGASGAQCGDQALSATPPEASGVGGRALIARLFHGRPGVCRLTRRPIRFPLTVELRSEASEIVGALTAGAPHKEPAGRASLGIVFDRASRRGIIFPAHLLCVVLW